jgi:hypothetical protein
MGRWLMLGVGLCACAGGAVDQAGAPSSVPGPEPPMVMDGAAADSDRDGLCDGTETALGTDPQAADTDGDELPDLIEIASSFAPVDPADPAEDQVAFLQGARGQHLDFMVRSTVNGDGQSLTGWFSAAGSFYRDEVSAADFFMGSTAVSADPTDAARSINQDSARFAAVLGKTRLAFNLRFDFGDRDDLSCGRAYPFRYAIKSDDGETQSERFYLLVVGASGAPELAAADLCLPANCE